MRNIKNPVAVALGAVLLLNALVGTALLVRRGATPFSPGGKTLVQIDLNAPIMWEGGGGLFGGGSGARAWISQLDRAAKDPSVAGVLLRVNSPGGTIGASQELYEAVKRVREGGKKVVVSVGDLCASGAYYASLPADRIIANPGSLVGSIGVILSAPELTGLMEKIGLRMNTVKSAPSKDILSPYRAMTGGERASLQELIDGMYGQFLDAVLTWRTNRAAGGSAAVMKRHADGRVFTGAQALKLGFIDGLGDERAARRELANLCGMNPESATVRRLGGGKWQDLLELSGLFPGRGLTGAHLEYRVQGF